MRIGIYKDLSNEEYHSHKESISRSAIMDFVESPYRYWANYLNPDKPCKEVSDAMIFGNAFHTFMLEPDKFDDFYMPEPKKLYLKDVGREKFDEYKAYVAELETSNKVILSDKDYLTLLRMKEALISNVKANELISDAVYEQSYFWQDLNSGSLVKARPDILHGNMIIDLKTCESAAPRAFQNAMVKRGYHVQGAMVQDAVYALEGDWIDTVINIAIEKKYPYAIAIYVIDAFALDTGRAMYKNVLLKMKESLERNEWESYGVQSISLPAWAVNL